MRCRILLLLMVLCVFGASQARATWQIQDILIYEGKEYPLLATMMSDYFKKFPDRDPEKVNEEQCSAAWRGYQAIFEVSNGLVYLKDIFAKPCSERISVLKKVVPDGKRLAIDWYTGLMPSVGGRNDVYLYDKEFLDSFERYAFFQVNNGKIGEVRQFDNKGYIVFKKRQFEGYKKTKEYQEAVKLSNGKPVKDLDEGIFLWFLLSMDRFYF